MTIAISAATLILIAAIMYGSLYLHRYGVSGLLYLAAAYLSALADAIVVGRAQYAKSVAQNRISAREAERQIVDGL